MSKAITPIVSAAVLAAGMTLVSGNAQAAGISQGDWLARVGASLVSPNESSSNPQGGLPAGSEVSVNDNTQLSFTIAYMFTNNLSFEVLAATPFKHDIEGAGALAGIGKIGETKHLPPTFSVNWHFQPQSNVRPYVGAGINYTTFFDEKATGALAGTSLKLDDSWGLAAQAGVDFDINPNWFLNANVRYIKISTTATYSNGYKLDVDLDPWVYTLAIGTRF